MKYLPTILTATTSILCVSGQLNYVRLKHISTGKCLYNNGPNVNSWVCWNDEGFAYSLDPIPYQKPFVLLRNVSTGNCIRAGKSDGSNVQSVTCNYSDSNQRFELEDAGKGTIRLKAVTSNQCLYGQNWNGALAKSWSCWNDSNMRFLLESASSPKPKVVSLGDSFSSGTGIWAKGDEYDEEYGGYVAPWKLTVSGDNECWRETDQTPGPRYANNIFLDYQSVFLACKGAEASHVENQIDLMNAQFPISAATYWENSIIMFTAGGNDIRTNGGMTWPDLIRHCILSIGGCHKKNENQVANWPVVQTRAQSIYTKLAMTASAAKVRVMGYPRIMQRDPECSSVTLVSRNEADWMDDQVDILNSNLQTAINNVKNSYPNLDIEFVSVYNYITRGACSRPAESREVNDKVLDGVSTSDSSFHPTLLGYQKYYDAFTDSL